MSKDLKTDHLNQEQKRIANTILKLLPKNASGGGCRAFYSPEEWTERGESYGSGSKLILCHDGGDLAPFCNMDRCNYKAVKLLNDALAKIGCYYEQCTTWYSAVYAV